MNQNNYIEKILSKIFEITGNASLENPVALHEPNFQNTNAWKYVKDCLDNSWVSSGGKWVENFEDLICKFTGSKYAVAITNGTDALRLALHCVGVKYDEEVILSPITFVATANAISHLGAIPHFVDIDSSSMGMSPIALQEHLEKITTLKNNKVYNKKTGRRIAAIVPVHVFGHPAEVQLIKTIGKKWNLPVIEDAAEALGSRRRDKKENIHCGLFGDIGIISFNGNKILTTGGGGVIITNNSNLASSARHLSTTAKLRHPWDYKHDQIGWNDRLPNINAALGVAQMENIEKTLRKKRKLAAFYKESFDELENVHIIDEPKNTISNYWLVTLRFDNPDINIASSLKIKLLEQAHSNGLLLRPVWEPLHKLKPFLNCPHGDLEVSEEEALRLVNLPSSPNLTN